MSHYAFKYAAEFLDSWLSLRARQIRQPGFSVAVGYEGQVIFEGAYGLAGVSSGERLTTKHLFSMGSQSKMLTAVAVMGLVEQGSLGLDEPIVAYLPWLKQAQDKRVRRITARQLLSHSSGLLRDGVDTDYWQLRRPFPASRELEEIICTNRLVFPANDRLKYSNIGYGLLGQVIESITGQSYHEYVVASVLKPLGLAMTTAPGTRKVSQGYTRPLDGSYLVNSLPIATDALASAVGWYATAADLCRFVYRLVNGPDQILAKVTLRQMHTNHPRRRVSVDYSNIEYGLGLQRLRLDNQLFIGHGGGFLGHRSCTYIDPAQKLSVAIMANTQDAPYIHMFRGVFQAVEFFIKYVHGPTPPSVMRFNAQLQNTQSIAQIVATPNKIVGFHVQDWLPFNNPAELRVVDATTLRIHRTHPFLADGEEIVFAHQGSRLDHVSFCGSTMWPLLPEE